MIINAQDYNICFNHNIKDELENIFQNNNYSKIFCLTDENTKKNCLSKITGKYELINIEIKSGEENKNLDTCSYIWNELSKNGADRKSLMINLGGGVIGDMGGFCAKTYQRGIAFINIPTTLLSQVDASVGGKLGIDFNNLKNQIGLFANPEIIFVNNDFLETLPERELSSGFAEIIKHGLIYDKDYWNKLKSEVFYENKTQSFKFSSKNDFTELVYESVKIKNDVVIKDPFEKGLRKILNFGHTAGHAIETYSLENDEIPLTHGESVAIGIIIESFISKETTGLKQNEFEEIVNFILSLYKKYSLNNINFETLIQLMKSDKKNEKSKINFTLLDKIGSSTINNFPEPKVIVSALEFYKNL